MSPIPTAEELLAGPRGRRLCWQMLQTGPLLQGANVDPLTVRRAVKAVVASLRDADMASDQIFKALRRSVDAAMYWQPPDDDDIRLRDAEVAGMLSPVAEALLHAAPTTWWPTPVALDRQRVVRFLPDDDAAQPPILSGVGARLQAWRADQQRRNMNHRAIRDGLDPRVPADRFETVSGWWWSTPTRWEVPATSRDRADIGPLGLWLVEDFGGWSRAVSWPLITEREPRVYEVVDPQSWAELVRQHPFDVTESRWPDWKRATGRAGTWLVPDWPAVAEKFDAVHVTVYAYLTTAGSAVPVRDDSATVMAGWAPDETFWLTDVMRLGGEPTMWASCQGDEWTAAVG